MANTNGSVAQTNLHLYFITRRLSYNFLSGGEVIDVMPYLTTHLVPETK